MDVLLAFYDCFSHLWLFVPSQWKYIAVMMSVVVPVMSKMLLLLLLMMMMMMMMIGKLVLVASILLPHIAPEMPANVKD